MEAFKTPAVDSSDSEAPSQTGAAASVILIAGEELGLRNSLQAVFKGKGFVVRHARLEGLSARARAVDASLVLCQIEGASCRRFEPLKLLQAVLPDLPVLAVTDSAQPNSRVEALEHGAADCVSQPIDSIELLARVRVQLRAVARLNQLATLAHVDELTGVYNRRGLMAQLQLVLARSIRDCRPFSLLMVDLDDFKQINDQFGHEVGDQVLRQAAQSLSSAVRGVDVVARLGGDEFVVVLTDCGRELARRVVERVERAMEVPASIGVTTPADDQCNVAQLLRGADRLMYEAKRQRKERREQLAAKR